MSAIAPSVAPVLDLFKGPLAGMRFGDVDAAALSLLAATVESAGAEVAVAEAKLAELRVVLASEQEALLALAQRALAYARVYAESHDELTGELNGISLPRPTKPRKASAPKASDPETASPPDSIVDAAALTPATASVDAREVELDEPADGEATPAPSARKGRRNRQQVAEAQSEGASTLE